MRTDALIEKLSEIHPKGFDLSLGRITRLLEKLDNPHHAIPPALHVAGTNGKGSTLAFIRSILEAAGYRVHVHTSPHLVHWQERYRLAGTFVDDNTLADAIERAAEANDGQPITIFEIMSAVMFLLFSAHDADFSLIEVGLGGRADATNVIAKPLVSTITQVALDHQAYLGDTIDKIAFEKAGIIKPGCPVVVGPQEDAARNVIEQVAAKHRCPIRVAGQDFDYYEDQTGFVFQDEDGLLDLPMPRLVGVHQLENAAIAIASVRASGIDVPENAYAEAMKTVYWPGRMERLPTGVITEQLGNHKEIWIDGGHNPAAGKAVADILRHQRNGHPQSLVMICGMLDTKEPVDYFRHFGGLDATVIAVPVAMSDAGVPPKKLAAMAQQAGLNSKVSSSLDEGIKLAHDCMKQASGSQILFCGSLYMIGEVLEKNGTPPI